MVRFSEQLTLACKDGADALKKLRKLMKRGCTDDHFNTDFNKLSYWNRRFAAEYSDSPCNLVVHKDGQVLIVGFFGEDTTIERVRDVENYRVK